MALKRRVTSTSKMSWPRFVMRRKQARRGNYDMFNVATDDYITVAEIADLAVKVSGLTPAM